MKRVLACILLCLMLLTLTACGGGDVGVISMGDMSSEVYTPSEINSGIDTVLDYFRKEFKGCSLSDLEYVGDERNRDFISYAERVGADEVLVFRSNFDVDERGGDGSLNPNTSYMGWLWILARTNGGEWEHVDHGY